MGAFNHRLEPASEYEAESSCSSCRGDYGTKPRAVCVLEYDYVTGRIGRVSHARRRLCQKHAQKTAEKYGLMERYVLLRNAGWPKVERSSREAMWDRLMESAITIGDDDAHR